MSEIVITPIVAFLALIVTTITLWYSNIRGPSITPIDKDVEIKLKIGDNIDDPQSELTIPFQFKIAIANSGNTGMVRSPYISFNNRKGLDDQHVKVEGGTSIDVEPSTSESSLKYGDDVIIPVPA